MPSERLHFSRGDEKFEDTVATTSRKIVSVQRVKGLLLVVETKRRTTESILALGPKGLVVLTHLEIGKEWDP